MAIVCRRYAWCRTELIAAKRIVLSVHGWNRVYQEPKPPRLFWIPSFSFPFRGILVSHYDSETILVISLVVLPILALRPSWRVSRQSLSCCHWVISNYSLLTAAFFAQAQVHYCSDHGECISMSIPATTSSNPDLYMTLQAPSSDKWFAFGFGSQMEGSLMFVVWPNGNQVVVSTRLAV
jgi:hypothetical protein